MPDPCRLATSICAAAAPSTITAAACPPAQGNLNQTHFDGSLETADPAQARKLAREMSVALDQLAERLQEMLPTRRRPTPGQLNLVLKELFDSILRVGDRRRALPEIRGLPPTVGDLETIEEGEGNEYTEGVRRI